MGLFNNILYVSEPTVAQEVSMARAVALAQGNQAKLTVIDVIPALAAGLGLLPGGRASGDLLEAMVAEREQALATLVAPFRERIDITVMVRVGTTFLEVISLVLSNDYDLLIKPAENPTFIERLYGSDDMQLLRNCPCPVWLTPADKKPGCTRILAAIDFNPYQPEAADDAINQQILALSGSLAVADAAALDIVHAWDAPGEVTVSLWSDNSTLASKSYVEGVRASHESAMERFAGQLKSHIGKAAYNKLAPQFHLRRGTPSRVIPALIKELNTDLVVMGTVARTGIAGLLIGNTAEAIFEQVQCAVLAVKPPGFVSPVKLAANES